MKIFELKTYMHQLTVGNTVVSIILDKPYTEEEIIDYITERLVGFDTDISTGDLLFYKHNGSYRNSMSFWFEYPKCTETTLDINSKPNEIGKEFKRIYFENKRNKCK